MKVNLVAGVTPVSLGSVAETADELARLITRCRGVPDPDVHASATQAAELAHRAAAGLVAVLEHPAADAALLLGVLVAGATRDPVESNSDIREVVAGQTPLGYPVVLTERVARAERLRAGQPFDCQLQATVTDPDRARTAVFTLSSSTGRGWLELSAIFGRLVSSVDFRD